MFEIDKNFSYYGKLNWWLEYRLPIFHGIWITYIFVLVPHYKYKDSLVITICTTVKYKLHYFYSRLNKYNVIGDNERLLLENTLLIYKEDLCL